MTTSALDFDRTVKERPSNGIREVPESDTTSVEGSTGVQFRLSE